MSSHFSVRFFIIGSVLSLVLLSACAADEPIRLIDRPDPEPEVDPVEVTFNGRLNLSDPFNYANQGIPDYIIRDNTGQNGITDARATLGRVLFYDRQLSSIGTVSCASCHRQELAFGDNSIGAVGVAGTTGRHSMRLVNARFGSESRYFWDKRANSLEEQTTQPIQDHIEMGFSGTNGDLSIDDLLDRLNALDYYGALFTDAFGSAQVSEPRMQQALAQFIRSIQSFDSKFDEGRALVQNGGERFPNFTDEENLGRELFGGRPQVGGDDERIGGGLGCGSCHQGPEFSIDPNSQNNGVTAVIGGGMPDFSVTRAPTLRDLFQPDGTPNGPFMHNGAFRTMDDVLDHYNEIPASNPQLDQRLSFAGTPQRLNMTLVERQAVIAFLKTLTGSAVYTDERWSDPFEQ
jgi:cytochrome c peroxidase